jgi:hypothetical protein
MALVNQIFRLLITSSRKRRLQRQFLELFDFNYFAGLDLVYGV